MAPPEGGVERLRRTTALAKHNGRAPRTSRVRDARPGSVVVTPGPRCGDRGPSAANAHDDGREGLETPLGDNP
ncbi:hypothetical protein GCM10010106_09760 [Thermopolyspora flexuosa]|nr:hypothetical protein GCM10010106_09760 [Thermopolyspora flexuosa]